MDAVGPTICFHVSHFICSFYLVILVKTYVKHKCTWCPPVNSLVFSQNAVLLQFWSFYSSFSVFQLSVSVWFWLFFSFYFSSNFTFFVKVFKTFHFDTFPNTGRNLTEVPHRDIRLHCHKYITFSKHPWRSIQCSMFVAFFTSKLSLPAFARYCTSALSYTTRISSVACWINV
jgi:hypothetical protein